jgi:hypothetical protein
MAASHNPSWNSLKITKPSLIVSRTIFDTLLYLLFYLPLPDDGLPSSSRTAFSVSCCSFTWQSISFSPWKEMDNNSRIFYIFKQFPLDVAFLHITHSIWRLFPLYIFVWDL